MRWRVVVVKWHTGGRVPMYSRIHARLAAAETPIASAKKVGRHGDSSRFRRSKRMQSKREVGACRHSFVDWKPALQCDSVSPEPSDGDWRVWLSELRLAGVLSELRLAGVWVSAIVTGVLNACTGILYAVAVDIARAAAAAAGEVSRPVRREEGRRAEARNRKLSVCRSPSTLGSRRPWTWPRLKPRRRTRQSVHGNATGFRLVRINPKSSALARVLKTHLTVPVDNSAQPSFSTFLHLRRKP